MTDEQLKIALAVEAWEPYQFTPTPEAVCRFCRQPGWVTHSIVHHADCVIRVGTWKAGSWRKPFMGRIK